MIHFRSNKNLILSAALIAGLAGIYGTEALAGNNTEANEISDPAYNSAVQLYQKGSYAEAQAAFEKLTNSKEVGELSRYYQALCLQQQKQFKAAQDQYMYLYNKAQNKNVRYKAWQALKTLPQSAPKSTTVASNRSSSSSDGSGADVWITPKEGYGRSGPAATSEVSVTVIPTSCGRRRR